MRSHRLLAVTALVLLVVGVVLLVIVAIGRMPRGLVTVAFLLVAAWIARDGILRRGAPRTIRLVLALVLMVAVMVVALTGEAMVAGLVSVALIVAGFTAARSALRVQARWPAGDPAEPPRGGVERQVRWREGGHAPLGG